MLPRHQGNQTSTNHLLLLSNLFIKGKRQIPFFSRREKEGNEEETEERGRSKRKKLVNTKTVAGEGRSVRGTAGSHDAPAPGRDGLRARRPVSLHPHRRRRRGVLKRKFSERVLRFAFRYLKSRKANSYDRVSSSSPSPPSHQQH
jgi:hypothetical protein